MIPLRGSIVVTETLYFIYFYILDTHFCFPIGTLSSNSPVAKLLPGRIPGQTSTVVNDHIRRNTTIYMWSYYDRISPCLLLSYYKKTYTVLIDLVWFILLNWSCLSIFWHMLLIFEIVSKLYVLRNRPIFQVQTVKKENP